MPSIFYPVSRRKTPGFPVGALLRKKPTKGEIGIEIEVEGNKFPKQSYNGSGSVGAEYIPAIWKYHKDGSLRGEDNAEYVLAKPIMFDKVPDAISSLWEMFEKYGSVLSESNRTSVHVHLNVQEFHLNRLCAFMAMYFAVEDILTAWCGDHRIGNLFCLRAKDAPAIVSQLKKFFQSDGQHQISDGMHYAGLNAQALFKFGSVEIRSLRGVNDPQIILDWVAVLERMYKLSADFKDPRALVDTFSGGGAIAFLEMILGDKVGVVRNNIPYDNQQVMESLYEGIRLAQDLCYCRDWSEYEPVDVKADPFGRDPTKTTQGSEINLPEPGYLMQTTEMSMNQYLAQMAVNQTVDLNTGVQPGSIGDVLQWYDALAIAASTSPAPSDSADDEDEEDYDWGEEDYDPEEE